MAEKRREIRDCSTVTGADLRVARQGQGESTRDLLHDSEWAPNSANGSIPSLIAWTVPKPPGNAAIVSDSGYKPLSVSKAESRRGPRDQAWSGPWDTPRDGQTAGF